MDLVAAVALVVEEVGERGLGGGTVETDQRADKQADGPCLSAGLGEGCVAADAGGDEDALEVGEVGRGERCTGANPAVGQ